MLDQQDDKKCDADKDEDSSFLKEGPRKQKKNSTDRELSPCRQEEEEESELSLSSRSKHDEVKEKKKDSDKKTKKSARGENKDDSSDSESHKKVSIHSRTLVGRKQNWPFALQCKHADDEEQKTSKKTNSDKSAREVKDQRDRSDSKSRKQVGLWSAMSWPEVK